MLLLHAFPAAVAGVVAVDISGIALVAAVVNICSKRYGGGVVSSIANHCLPLKIAADGIDVSRISFFLLIVSGSGDCRCCRL